MAMLISTDTRGRATLGQPNRDYRVTSCTDGSLLLEPAVVVSELELRFLSNTALQSEIAHYHAHPDELVVSARRHSRRAR